MISIIEALAEAFTRKHLVLSLYHALALEVRGIGVELSSAARRQII